MSLSIPGVEQSALRIKEIVTKISIIGHTTQASILTFAPYDPFVTVYHEDDTRTVTAIDSGIGFALTDLDNDAPPATLGFLLTVGDAAELVGVELVVNSIKSIAMTAPMTALGTVTLKGAAKTLLFPTKAGTSGDPSGVTASGNIAFIADLTSLNIDEDAATVPNNEFWLRIVYKKTQPV